MRAATPSSVSGNSNGGGGGNASAFRKTSFAAVVMPASRASSRTPQPVSSAAGIGRRRSTPTPGAVAAVSVTATATTPAAAAADLFSSSASPPRMEEAETFVVNLLKSAYVPPPSGESMTMRAAVAASETNQVGAAPSSSPHRKHGNFVATTPSVGADRGADKSHSVLRQRQALTGIPDALFDSSFEARDAPIASTGGGGDNIAASGASAALSDELQPRHRFYYGFSTGVVRTLSKMHGAALQSAQRTYSVRTCDLVRRRMGHLLKGVFGEERVDAAFQLAAAEPQEIDGLENVPPIHDVDVQEEEEAEESGAGEENDGATEETNKNRRAAAVAAKSGDEVVGASLGFLLGLGEEDPAESRGAKAGDGGGGRSNQNASDKDDDGDDGGDDEDRPLTRAERERLLSDAGDADFESEIARVRQVVGRTSHAAAAEADRIAAANAARERELRKLAKKRKAKELALEALQREQLEQQRHPRRDPSRKRPLLDGTVLPDPTILLEMIVAEHAEMRAREDGREEARFQQLLQRIEDGSQHAQNEADGIIAARSAPGPGGGTVKPASAAAAGSFGARSTSLRGGAQFRQLQQQQPSAVKTSGLDDGFIEHFHHKLQWALREVFDVQKASDVLQAQYNYIVLESAKRLAAMEELMDAHAAERTAHAETRQQLERERERSLVLFERHQQDQQRQQQQQSSPDGDREAGGGGSGAAEHSGSMSASASGPKLLTYGKRGGRADAAAATRTPSPLRRWDEERHQQQQHQQQPQNQQQRDKTLSSQYRRRGRFSSLPHRQQQFLGSDRMALMTRSRLAPEDRSSGQQQPQQSRDESSAEVAPMRRRHGSPSTDDVDWEGQSARCALSMPKAARANEHQAEALSDATTAAPAAAAANTAPNAPPASSSSSVDPLHLTFELARLRADNAALQSKLDAAAAQQHSAVDAHFDALTRDRDALKRALDFAHEELEIAQRVKSSSSDEVQALAALLVSLRREVAKVVDVVAVEREKGMRDFLTVAAAPALGSVGAGEIRQMLQIDNAASAATAASNNNNSNVGGGGDLSTNAAAAAAAIDAISAPWAHFLDEKWKRALRPSLLAQTPAPALLGKADAHEPTTAMHLVNLGMNTLSQLRQLLADIHAAANDTTKAQHDAARQLQHERRELKRAILQKRKEDEKAMLKLKQKAEQERQRFVQLQVDVGIVQAAPAGHGSEESAAAAAAALGTTAASSLHESGADDDSAVGKNSSRNAGTATRSASESPSAAQSRPGSGRSTAAAAATTTTITNVTTRTVPAPAHAEHHQPPASSTTAVVAAVAAIQTVEAGVQTSPSLLPLQPARRSSSSVEATTSAAAAAAAATPLSHHVGVVGTAMLPPPSAAHAHPPGSLVAATATATGDAHAAASPPTAAADGGGDSPVSFSPESHGERHNTDDYGGDTHQQFAPHRRVSTADAAVSTNADNDGDAAAGVDASLQTDPPELVRVPFQFTKTRDFLCGLGLSDDVFLNFVALRLNDDMLPYLDDGDLLSAGIERVAHRRAIYTALGKNPAEIDAAVKRQQALEEAALLARVQQQQEEAAAAAAAAAGGSGSSNRSKNSSRPASAAALCVSTAVQTEAVGKVVTRSNFCQTAPPEIDLLSGSVPRTHTAMPTTSMMPSGAATNTTASSNANPAAHGSAFRPLPPAGATTATTAAAASAAASSTPAGLPPRAASPSPPSAAAGAGAAASLPSTMSSPALASPAVGGSRPTPLDADALLGPTASIAVDPLLNPASANGLRREGSMAAAAAAAAGGGSAKPKPKPKGKQKPVRAGKDDGGPGSPGGRGVLDTMTEADLAEKYVAMAEHDVVKRKLEAAILNFNDTRARLATADAELRETSGKMKMTSEQLRATQERLIETSRARDVELVAARENAVELTNAKERVAQLEKKLILAEEKRMQESLQAIEDLKRVQDQLEAALHSDVVDKLKAKERLFLGGSQATIQALKSLSTALCCPACFETLREAVLHVPCGHVLCRACVVQFHEEDVGCTVRVDPITGVLSVSGISYNKRGGDGVQRASSALRNRRAKQHVVALLPSREFMVEAPPALSPVKGSGGGGGGSATFDAADGPGPNNNNSNSVGDASAASSPTSPQQRQRAGSPSSPSSQQRSNASDASFITSAQHLRSLRLCCAECARAALHGTASNAATISLTGGAPHSGAARRGGGGAAGSNTINGIVGAGDQPLLIRFGLMDTVVGAFEFAWKNAQTARRAVIKDMLVVEAREDGQDDGDVTSNERKMKRIEEQTEEQIGDLEASAAQVTVRPVAGSKVHPNALKGRLVPLVQCVELDDDDGHEQQAASLAASAASGGSFAVRPTGRDEEDAVGKLAEAAAKWA